MHSILLSIKAFTLQHNYTNEKIILATKETYISMQLLSEMQLCKLI